MGASQILLSLVLTLLHFSCSQGELFRVRKDEAVIESQETDTKLYVVYMGHVSPTAPKDVFQKNVLSRVLGSLKAAEESIVYTYNNGFRGFAAMLSTEQAEAMRTAPGVVSVFVSRSVTLQTTASYNFLGFSTTKGVWPASNFGENTIVGLLDSGIWPESESFNDDGMPPVPATWKGSCVTAEAFGPENCNRKLIGAKFYVKGYEASHGPLTGKEQPAEFRSPRDSEGHGTHTASTAAGRRVSNTSLFGLGQGTATGGAPSARLAMYKVCWANGCYNADILAAFDDAIADGVDILSLSLGGAPSDYQDDSIAIGGFHAVAKGILVATSAGNSGPFRGSVSNIAPWLLTVAASTINRQFLATVRLGNGKTYQGVTINTFTMEAGKMYPLVYGGDIPAKNATSEDASYCEPDTLNKNAAKGKIVICYLSGASDDTVNKAGGVGVILIEDLYAQVGFTFSIPASSVNQATANKVLSYMSSTKTPTARIEKSDTVFDAAPAPVTAVFSSRGPNTITPDILKPDITAPGVDILAAWSPAATLTYENDNRKVDYNIISGTSMSCPHVTGAAAVVKSLHPDWSPAAIKSALMTTASPFDESSSDEDLGLSVGSGQINPASFGDPGLVYDITTEDYEKFLCSIGYTTKQLRLIRGDKSVCPKVTPLVLDLNYPSIFVSSNRSRTQTLTRTVTNVGPETCIYKVSVVPPKGVEMTVTPSTLSFDTSNKKRTFTVKITADTSDDAYVFGSVTWTDGPHSVRIPVGVGPPMVF